MRLNQEEFAEKLKIKQSYYSAMERGEKPISSKVLNVLFDEIKVSRHWFYFSKGFPIGPDGATEEEFKKFVLGDPYLSMLKDLMVPTEGKEANNKEKDDQQDKITIETFNERLLFIEREVKELKDFLHSFFENVYKKDQKLFSPRSTEKQSEEEVEFELKLRVQGDQKGESLQFYTHEQRLSDEKKQRANIEKERLGLKMKAKRKQ